MKGAPAPPSEGDEKRGPPSEKTLPEWGSPPGRARRPGREREDVAGAQPRALAAASGPRGLPARHRLDVAVTLPVLLSSGRNLLGSQHV